MFRRLLSGLALAFLSTTAFAAPGEGMVVTASRYSVAETAERAVTAIEAKGLKLMARIDHAAGARAAGLVLPPTELLIFGNPKVGTALMRCNPSVAIDLPQKLLVWEEADGTTRIAYNAPAWLDARYKLGACSQVLDKIGHALAAIAAAAGN